MQIKDLPATERPLEKAVFSGVGALSTTELLAVLIHSGTRERSALDLAEQVLSLSGGLPQLGEMTVQELMGIDGIGRGKSVRILSALELGRRMTARREEKQTVRTPADAARLVMEEMRHLPQESFRVLLLNAKGDVISIETVSVGELTATLVHPREVFRSAIRRSAAAVVLVHNHPSGDPTPSREDLDTTYRLMDCGKLLGIRVADHLIIGDGVYTSLLEKNLLGRAEGEVAGRAADPGSARHASEG